ncbi:hypothetical protein Moror_2960 [Moniliophthora roreri MCA 2997]|uniref:Uncharacterized protein n=1 Tax=Moniliophthora roreri (strain MCA 2997) TaxID=1381753 RepID=V2WKL9_MONRO|nr:hypothetical protein Moror_2960 [Moniliophthora roreri MCA 2997]
MVVEQGGRYDNPFPLFSIAYAIRRHRRNSRIAATSRNAAPAKVNGYSPIQQPRNRQEALLGASWVDEHEYDVAEDQRRRLCIDLDTNTTPSSYPDFRTPKPAPEYAGLGIPRPHLCLEIDAITTLTSSNPFPVPLPALKYAGQPALAYFGSLNPFLTSAEIAGPVFTSFGDLSEASEDSRNDEFVAAVVPEATESQNTTMVMSSVPADITNVFGDLENLRSQILGIFGDDAKWDYLQATGRLEGRRRRRENGFGAGYEVGSLGPSPSSTSRMLVNAADETPKKPPPHSTCPIPKSSAPAQTNGRRTSQTTLPGIFWATEHVYDVVFASILILTALSPPPSAFNDSQHLTNTPETDSADTFVVRNWAPLASHHLELVSRPKN